MSSPLQSTVIKNDCVKILAFLPTLVYWFPWFPPSQHFFALYLPPANVIWIYVISMAETYWFTLLNVIAILGKSEEYTPSSLWLLQTGGRTIAKNETVVFFKILKFTLALFFHLPYFRYQFLSFLIFSG